MRAANTPGPDQPPPIVIDRPELVVGWTPFVGPDAEVRHHLSTFVFELMGHSKLDAPEDIRDAIWTSPNTAVPIPVRFGDLAAGEIWVVEDEQKRLQTPFADQMIPFLHPKLPDLESEQAFALTVNVSNSEVTGELVLTADPAQPPHGSVPPMKKLTGAELPEILGLDDLQGVECWIGVNALGFGKYELAVMFDDFRLDGVFPKSDSKVSFLHLRDDYVHFEAFADVAAKGVAKTVVPIERDELGELSAHARLAADLEPLPGHKIFGKLDATFDRGVFSATGRVSYASEKIQGEVEVVLTDLRTAREIARNKLGALAPPEPGADAAPNGLALTGSGILEFDFNKWLRGHAEVIIDPDGYVTTLGHIVPDAQVEVFKRKSVEKTLFHESDWGVTWVDVFPVPWWWAISLKAHAFVGPALLGDLSVEGVYSTHPGVSRHFSIAGTLVIPAEVGADLDAHAKGGIPKLANVGGEISASARVRLHAGVRPRIGWDRPGRSGSDDPVSGRFFIDGEVFGGADIILALRGGVTAQVAGKKASWKPLHRTWRLGRLRYHAGGKVILGSPIEPTTWSFETGDKHKRAEYEQLLDDASIAKMPAGEGKEDPLASEWVEGVTDTEREPEGYTPPEPQLGPAHVETPTLAGGDLPSDEHVDPSAGPPAATPAPAHEAPPSGTRPANVLPPPERATAPADLVMDFEMMDYPHQLFLTRGQSPQILMASGPRSPLGKRLKDALDALDRSIALPPSGRSAEGLAREREALNIIYKDTLAAELEAKHLAYDVTQGIPEHFPKLHYIAGELQKYSYEFDRSELVYVPVGGPQRHLVVSTFDDGEVDRKLTQLRLVPADRERVIKSLHEVPVGARGAEHIISGVFDTARHYDEVLKTLKNRNEVGDTLVVLDRAKQLFDEGFQIVFEAQEDPELVGSGVDVDIAALDGSGAVVYAIAVKRPRDIWKLAAKINEAITQLRGARAKQKIVVAYLAHGTEEELRTKYRQGVINAQTTDPDVEIRIVLATGVELSPEDI